MDFPGRLVMLCRCAWNIYCSLVPFQNKSYIHNHFIMSYSVLEIFTFELYIHDWNVNYLIALYESIIHNILVACILEKNTSHFFSIKFWILIGCVELGRCSFVASGIIMQMELCISWYLLRFLIHFKYRKTFSISRNKSQNLNFSRLLLQWSLPNPLKPSVTLRMKM